MSYWGVEEMGNKEISNKEMRRWVIRSWGVRVLVIILWVICAICEICWTKNIRVNPCESVWIRGRSRIEVLKYSCDWLRPLSSRLGKDIKRACVSALAAPIIRGLKKSAKSARSAWPKIIRVNPCESVVEVELKYSWDSCDSWLKNLRDLRDPRYSCY